MEGLVEGGSVYIPRNMEHNRSEGKAAWRRQILRIMEGRSKSRCDD